MNSTSDKHYWHRYTDFYEQMFSRVMPVENILEFGVLRGDSIRWLRARFPAATIVGVDILPMGPEWPRDDRIKYRRVDQAERDQVRSMFEELNTKFDLIIEDGSHIPEHQASCLIVAFPWLRAGGVYILEDIHTSHPRYPKLPKHARGIPNSLSVLLAIQHMKALGRQPTPEFAHQLSSPKFFSRAEIEFLTNEIRDLELYKRTSLPLRCFACGSSDFRYARYSCRCGFDLYGEAEIDVFRHQPRVMRR